MRTEFGNDKEIVVLLRGLVMFRAFIRLTGLVLLFSWFPLTQAAEAATDCTAVTGTSQCAEDFLFEVVLNADDDGFTITGINNPIRAIVNTNVDGTYTINLIQARTRGWLGDIWKKLKDFFTSDIKDKLVKAVKNLFFGDDDTITWEEPDGSKMTLTKSESHKGTITVERPDGTKITGSLVVELVNFIATPFKTGIRVHWVTASEIDNAGFYIWRAAGEGWKQGDYSQVTKLDQFIHSKGDKVGGYPYSYIDSNVESGITYYYGLEDIDFKGESTVHWDFIDEATAK
jgi:hypothetical protein